ncbi:aminotransferase [Pilimelia terevasa]|uniref:Aminotransferase n=1 Tax=Pilimelia terevasa TaxID=53372 RepID=A0A8J3BUE9_9ACTN|nr:Rv2231c family pyridoxal phosphate-dependent protein CobC [Pilimelia terevasa]GGK38357.1 aminotransferase [Pilimelia terevasa]
MTEPEYTVGPDLDHHGDAEVGPGLVDLAVNVRPGPPAWLAASIAASLARLASYPDPRPARDALARRHARPPNEALLTAGAAEAFVLLARTARPRHAVVVHPQFTEPERALRQAGHPVDRLLLHPDEDFALDPDRVPASADLVVLGNPTNPTSVLHPAAAVAALARPGRILVVDEAFADTTCRPAGPTPGPPAPRPPAAGPSAAGPPADGEPESLAGRRDLPGLLVVRSLTKTWGLAGLRVGYVLGEPDLLAALADAQPRWSVSGPACAAAAACATPAAVAAERVLAAELAAARAHLVAGLRGVPGVGVAGHPASAFVLIRCAGADRIRLALRERGWAVRRGDTFPGLGADWLRVAVRDTATTDAFVAVLTETIRSAA